MNVVDAIPLSAAQLQLWAGQLLEPHSPMYIMALVVRIDGAVDPDRMQAAWWELQKRNAGIAVRIVEHDGVMKQQFAQDPVPLVLDDVSAEADPDAALRHRLQHATETPFGLDDVLVSASLTRLAEDRWAWYIRQHHVVTDAWSFAIIWRQLIALHGTEDIGQISPQSDTNDRYRSFADYVLSQSDAQSDAQAASQDADFWSAGNDGDALHPFGRQPSTTGMPRRSLGIDPARRERIDELAMRPSSRALSTDLSRATVLLTVLMAYLSRVGGNTCVTVGVPTPNRTDPRDVDTPGLYVEVLPLSLDLADDETFASLARRVRTALMQHLKHAYPGASDAASGTGTNAIFNYINVALDAVDGWTLSPAWLHSGHADREHAVRLQVTDWLGTGKYALDIDLDAHVYAEGREEYVAAHWWALVDAMHADENQAIAGVDMLSADEARQYVAEDVDARDDISALSLLARFARSVARHPRDIAVSAFACGQAGLNYAELDELSDRMAHRLIRAGVVPGSRVALYQSRSIDAVVSILAVLKCAAAYVPIDVGSPVIRIASLVEDVRADVLVVDTALDVSLPGSCAILDVAPLLGESAGTALSGDSVAAEIAAQLPSVSPESTAYILYTSGSTGTPKGVVVSHAALANYLNWAARYYASDASVSFPLFTPLGFDLTVTSLFVPLVTGGELRVYPPREGGADTVVFDVFDEDRVDIVKLTPSHLSLMQDRALVPARIAQLIVGGEAFGVALAARMHACLGGRVVMHNEYGPTEATVGCVVHAFDPAADTDAAVPIGRAIHGVDVCVLNDHGQLQPSGVEGELYIGGKSLADGYWQRDDLTAAAFVEVTIDKRVRRLYRTGDRVRRDGQGRLVYLGRRDEQLKVRGVRIETAEIEAACLSLSGIAECAVDLVAADASAFADDETHCVRCGLSSRLPEANIDAEKICSLCRNFEQYESRARAYFRSMSELEAIVEDARCVASGDYDCIMLLSGGKDSSYALSCLVDHGLRVLAFTLDNGFISDQAKANIARVCKALNVDHRYGETPAMNEIFADSLKRHSNVCNGCFKVLYTLSIELALELNISTIFTGLSRGQFFETRLTEELFTMSRIDDRAIDDSVLTARRAYHLVDDAVSRCMDVSQVRDPDTFDKVRVVDFYRYSAVSLDEMYDYLENRLPWVRPSDTGRSTNCLINEVGIYVHRKERGYHNYSLPYSWDVRLGHKERDAALEELDDEIDEAFVADVLDQVGYTLKTPSIGGSDRLALYYVASDDGLTPEAVRKHLERHLPRWQMPGFIVPLDALPLSDNGKVARAELPVPSQRREGTTASFRAAATETERWLAALWIELLRVDSIGIDDNYFELNGDSLTAIRLVARINRDGHHCTVADLFASQTVAILAQLLDEQRAADAETLQPDETESVNADATPSKDERFGALDPSQLDKLSTLLGSGREG